MTRSSAHLGTFHMEQPSFINEHQKVGNKKAYDEGWEKIFGMCKKHPKYTGKKRKPRSKCEKCWQIYRRERG